MKPILMLAAAAVSTGLLLPTVSQAATESDQAIVSEQVGFADLDLATAEGRAELQARIDSSIRRVCADTGALDLQARLAVRECMKLAKQQSVRQVQLALAAKGNRVRA